MNVGGREAERSRLAKTRAKQLLSIQNRRRGIVSDSEIMEYLDNSTTETTTATSGEGASTTRQSSTRKSPDEQASEGGKVRLISPVKSPRMTEPPSKSPSLPDLDPSTASTQTPDVTVEEIPFATPSSGGVRPKGTLTSSGVAIIIPPTESIRVDLDVSVTIADFIWNYTEISNALRIRVPQWVKSNQKAPSDLSPTKLSFLFLALLDNYAKAYRQLETLAAKLQKEAYEAIRNRRSALRGLTEEIAEVRQTIGGSCKVVVWEDRELEKYSLRKRDDFTKQTRPLLHLAAAQQLTKWDNVFREGQYLDQDQKYLDEMSQFYRSHAIEIFNKIGATRQKLLKDVSASKAQANHPRSEEDPLDRKVEALAEKQTKSTSELNKKIDALAQQMETFFSRRPSDERGYSDVLARPRDASIGRSREDFYDRYSGVGYASSNSDRSSHATEKTHKYRRGYDEGSTYPMLGPGGYGVAVDDDLAQKALRDQFEAQQGYSGGCSAYYRNPRRSNKSLTMEECMEVIRNAREKNYPAGLKAATKSSVAFPYLANPTRDFGGERSRRTPQYTAFVKQPQEVDHHSEFTSEGYEYDPRRLPPRHAYGHSPHRRSNRSEYERLGERNSGRTPRPSQDEWSQGSSRDAMEFASLSTFSSQDDDPNRKYHCMVGRSGNAAKGAKIPTRGRGRPPKVRPDNQEAAMPSSPPPENVNSRPIVDEGYSPLRVQPSPQIESEVRTKKYINGIEQMRMYQKTGSIFVLNPLHFDPAPPRETDILPIQRNPLQYPGDDWYLQLPPPWNTPPRQMDPAKDNLLSRGRTSKFVFKGELGKYWNWRRDVIPSIHMAPTSLAEKRQDIAARLDLPSGSYSYLVMDIGEDWWIYSRLIFGLERAFGGKDRLLHYHHQQMKELPEVTRNMEYSIAEDWKTKVERYIQALREMDETAELESYHTYIQIFDKFSSELQEDFMEWFRRQRPEEYDPKIAHIIEWMGYKLSIWITRTTSMKPTQKRSSGEKVARLTSKKDRVFVQAEPESSDKSSRNVEDQQTQANEEEDLPELSTRKAFAQFNKPPPKTKEASKIAKVDEWNCDICKDRHLLKQCPKYLGMSPKDRSEMLRTNNRCFRCLRKGHRINECSSKTSCKVAGCHKTHHTTLHGYKGEHTVVKQLVAGAALEEDSNDNLASQESEFTYEEEEEDQAVILMNTSLNSREEEQVEEAVSKYALPIIPVMLTNPKTGASRIFNALLDSGSEVSMLSEKASRELKLKEAPTKMVISGVLGKTERIQAHKAKVILSDYHQRMERLLKIKVVPDPVGELKPTDWNLHKKQWRHIHQVEFIDCPRETKDRVDMIIGQDHQDLMYPLETISAGPDTPTALRTPLGWTGQGRISPYYLPRTRLFKAHVFLQSLYRGRDALRIQQRDNLERDLNEMVKLQWSMEQTPDDEEWLSPIGQQRAIQRLKGSLQYTTKDDGKKRVTLSCLWKEGEPILQNNYVYTLNRLLNLERSKRFKIPGVRERYNAKVQDLIDKQYVVDVTETDPQPEVAYYLPMFPVVREDKESTPIRLVLDGAARCGVPPKSLNDAIEAGPNMIQDLVAVLHKFRHRQIAIVGDIKEMFLQINLTEGDKKYHRFLHRNTPTEPVREYEFRVHCFGNTGSPAIALFAVRSYAETVRDKYPLAYDAIVTATLMDDTLTSVTSVEEALETIKQLKQVHADISMDLRKFASNDPQVLAKIEEKDRLPGCHITESLTTWTIPTMKALGVSWDPNTDTFSFTYDVTSIDDGQGTITKRRILKSYARLFDPLGIAAPYIVLAKTIFQDAWKEGKEWDDELPETFAKRWIEWTKNIPALSEIRVPRCLSPGDRDDILREDIHVFCDASAKAYGAVIYHRTMHQNGQVSIRFNRAKSHLAPTKPISIPRLELNAAVLALKIGRQSAKALGLLPCSSEKISPKSITFWTDSACVYYWLRATTTKLQVYVANRIQKIHDGTHNESWKWVPTDDNPADLVSRGVLADELNKASLWWQGPSFLADESLWPTLTPATSDEITKEYKKSARDELQMENSDIVVIAKLKKLSPTLLDRVSRWTTLRNIVARIYWWRDRSKHKGRMTEPKHHTQAETYLFRLAQSEVFKKELNDVRAQGHVTSTSPLYQLQPCSSPEGLLRIHSRLSGAKDLPEDEKFPIILPPQHRVTVLLVQHLHEIELKHIGGSMHLLATLNQRFRVPRGRSLCRSITSRCLRCLYVKKQFARKQPGLIPDFRVPSPNERPNPFAYTALDAAGPFVLKRPRGSLKVWIIVFVCLMTKAIAIELVDSLDTSAFLMAFQRFSSTHGTPTNVLSDNGGNFRRGSKELFLAWEALDKVQINEHYPKTKWMFTPPYAPHMNGAAERAVQIAKRAIYRIAEPGTMNFEEFRTLIAMAADLCNTRPLGYISSDMEDPQPLTPNHFLRGSATMKPPLFTDDIRILSKRLKYLTSILDKYWCRFAKELITEMNKDPKFQGQRTNIREGDLVLMQERAPLGSWRKGIVLTTLPGRDGRVRVIKLKVVDEKGRPSIKERHINQVVPLLRLD